MSVKQSQEEHQKLLDDMLERINKVSLELARTRPAFRKEVQERLDMMTANYNMMIDKRSGNKIKSLYDTTPQTPEQIAELYKLIDSV